MTTAIRPLERLEERSEKNPTGPLFRDFVFTREADDAPDAPIRLAISSEAPVLRWDWRSGTLYYEVLDHSPNAVDLSYVRDGIPFCLDHWLSKQIGLGENIRVEGDRKLRCDVIEGSHPDAEWTFKDIRSGVRKKVSVGYDPGDEYVETKNAGDEHPTRRYTRWMPYEVSSVTVPADYDVGIGRDARGVAKPEPLPATEAAQTARTSEDVMTEDEQETAGRGSAAIVEKKGPSREAALSALAAKHNRGADLPAWILENRTVDDVKDMLLDEKGQRNAERPQVGGAAPKVEVGKDRAEDKPWDSFTEFMRGVKRAASGMVEPRLASRAATGLGIGTDADGGFLIPEQFAAGVVTRAFEGGQILSRVNHIPVTGNQYHMSLVDETSRSAGSRWGGIRSYRIGEGTAPTASKPKFRRATLDVTKKLGVAAYVSEEQLEDASATDTILSQAMTEEVVFATESEIWSGIGGAQCLGVMNSGALVTQAKVSGQAADTVVAGNATDMNARLWTGSHRSAAWYVNQMVLGQLPQMTIGNQPVWLPPTGLVGSSPFGTLLGKPIFVVEYASILGDVGDMNLFDFGQYALGDKARNQIARSMHVKFLEGEEVFRLIYRVDGLPMWNNTLTLADGTTTVSPFITLAARA
ncbi:MAG: phage major capsid protein [Gemmatimonadaceae bacterium]|nr:phage major capsid protein [Gemmatimonadaceae bacterium]